MLEYSQVGGHKVVALRFPDSHKSFDLSAGVCYHEPEKVMVMLRAWHAEWSEIERLERKVSDGDSGNDDAGPADAGASQCDGAEDNAGSSNSD